MLNNIPTLDEIIIVGNGTQLHPLDYIIFSGDDTGMVYQLGGTDGNRSEGHTLPMIPVCTIDVVITHSESLILGEWNEDGFSLIPPVDECAIALFEMDMAGDECPYEDEEDIEYWQMMNGQAFMSNDFYAL